MQIHSVIGNLLCTTAPWLPCEVMDHELFQGTATSGIYELHQVYRLYVHLLAFKTTYNLPISLRPWGVMEWPPTVSDRRSGQACAITMRQLSLNQ